MCDIAEVCDMFSHRWCPEAGSWDWVTMDGVVDKQEQIKNTWECGLFISQILRNISNAMESIQRWDYSSQVHLTIHN